MNRSGFTLVELLVYVAIFSIIAVLFLAILTSMLGLQARQSAAAEVLGQSQFLLQTIQRHVEESSLIDMTADTSTSTLRLRKSATSTDPTVIYLSAGGVYVSEAGGTAVLLTSNKVVVSDLSFVKRTNTAGYDSVSVVFSMNYNAPNSKWNFANTLRTSVARVSAATFDSGIFPAATSTSFKLGSNSQAWASINDTVYFSGSNVGIGVSSPGQTLELNGGLRLNTATARPTCDSNQRGTFWVTQSGAGVKDAVAVCVKNASDTYLWSTIY